MKCIVCGKNSWNNPFSAQDRMFELPGKFFIYRCRHCGLLRVAPKLTSSQLAAYYPPKKYYSYQHSYSPGVFWRLRTFLVKRNTIFSKMLNVVIHVPAIPEGRSPGKIMDIGCGSGDTLSLLRDIGWETYGLDIDKQAVVIAHRNNLSNVKHGSYTSLRTYPDGFFDVIRLYHVIEHLDDPQLLLRLAHKKLKKGGELIIGTPNADSLLAKTAGTYWYNLDSPRHLFIFSPGTLGRLLTDNTFSVESLDFSSIGGIVGTVQYFFTEKLGLKRKFIYNAWAIILMYPLERILDWCGAGDICLIMARKK